MKGFLVVGLGAFGGAVARTLRSMGHTVLGIDNDPARVAKAKDFATEVIEADATDRQVMESLDLEDIEQPVVDLTPSPAVSSFILYRGNAFPEWRHSAIVGTLKATELYRMVIEDDRVVHTETLLKGLARLRDIEVGSDGLIYLLLEHASGGQILRLVPQGSAG